MLVWGDLLYTYVRFQIPILLTSLLFGSHNNTSHKRLLTTQSYSNHNSPSMTWEFEQCKQCRHGNKKSTIDIWNVYISSYSQPSFLPWHTALLLSPLYPFDASLNSIGQSRRHSVYIFHQTGRHSFPRDMLHLTSWLRSLWVTMSSITLYPLEVVCRFQGVPNHTFRTSRLSIVPFVTWHCLSLVVDSLHLKHLAHLSRQAISVL